MHLTVPPGKYAVYVTVRGVGLDPKWVRSLAGSSGWMAALLATGGLFVADEAKPPGIVGDALPNLLLDQSGKFRCGQVLSCLKFDGTQEATTERRM